MNELQKHIDQAYKLISAFAVKGDGVEVIAGVREHLRQAYALAENDPQPEETPDKPGAEKRRFDARANSGDYANLIAEMA